MANIIFLDIDGVMNSELLAIERLKQRWYNPTTYWWKIKKWIKWVFNGFKFKSYSLANHKTPKNFWDFNRRFKDLKRSTCPLKWNWLVELCKETNSKICISSTWKHSFKNPLIEWEQALTKLGFPEHTFVGITGDRRTLRGTEIKEWLEDVSYDNYIIIDDDADMLLEQADHFFQTDPYIGLTPTICYKIKCFLEKGARPKLY